MRLPAEELHSERITPFLPQQFCSRHVVADQRCHSIRPCPRRQGKTDMAESRIQELWDHPEEDLRFDGHGLDHNERAPVPWYRTTPAVLAMGAIAVAVIAILVSAMLLVSRQWHNPSSVTVEPSTSTTTPTTTQVRHDDGQRKSRPAASGEDRHRSVDEPGPGGGADRPGGAQKVTGVQCDPHVCCPRPRRESYALLRWGLARVMAGMTATRARSRYWPIYPSRVGPPQGSGGVGGYSGHNGPHRRGMTLRDKSNDEYE